MDLEVVKRYIEVRNKRKELTTTVGLLEKEEKKLKAQVLPMIPKLGEIKVDNLTIRKVSKIKPLVSDWLQFFEYIRVNNAFDLLHKRVTETAVKLRWDDKVQIPGVVGTEDENIEVEINE